MRQYQQWEMAPLGSADSLLVCFLDFFLSCLLVYTESTVQVDVAVGKELQSRVLFVHVGYVECSFKSVVLSRTGSDNLDGVMWSSRKTRRRRGRTWIVDRGWWNRECECECECESGKRVTLATHDYHVTISCLRSTRKWRSKRQTNYAPVHGDRKDIQSRVANPTRNPPSIFPVTRHP